MNKAIYLFFAVVALIVLSVGMLFYNLDPVIVNHTSNITFRDTKLQGPLKNRNWDEQMVATLEKSSHRNLNVKKYQGKIVADINSPSINKSVSYVNGDLSLMSNSTMPRVALSGTNQPIYRRFMVDNSSSQMVANVAGYQSLHIRQPHSHVHSYGGVIETGGMLAAGCDHVLDLSTGSCANGCGATLDIEAFLKENGTLGGLTNENAIWKEPLGDVILPMLMMVLGYLLTIFIKRH